jgi:hypothetical protein
MDPEDVDETPEPELTRAEVDRLGGPVVLEFGTSW